MAAEDDNGAAEDGGGDPKAGDGEPGPAGDWRSEVDGLKGEVRQVASTLGSLGAQLSDIAAAVAQGQGGAGAAAAGGAAGAFATVAADGVVEDRLAMTLPTEPSGRGCLLPDDSSIAHFGRLTHPLSLFGDTHDAAAWHRTRRVVRDAIEKCIKHVRVGGRLQLLEADLKQFEPVWSGISAGDKGCIQRVYGILFYAMCEVDRESAAAPASPAEPSLTVAMRRVQLGRSVVAAGPGLVQLWAAGIPPAAFATYIRTQMASRRRSAWRR